MDPPLTSQGENKETDNQNEQTAACFKAFLMTNSTKTNLNLYDHLTELLVRLMDERPENAVDVIEDMSHDVKWGTLQDRQSTLRSLPITSAAELTAKQQQILFTPREEVDQDDELIETPLPNVPEICFYLDQIGVGFDQVEMERIFLAYKLLVDSQPMQCCRFWGKIQGTESNYLVAECEYREGEEELHGMADTLEDEEREADAQDDDEVNEDVTEEVDHLPQSTYKPPPVAPKEANGTGVNKFVYYVCKEPGLPWVRLPPVTPAQINAARQIRKFFTGRLDAPVVSYPPFPGNEANYLRAQIARISAGTQVSPVGFFQFAEEEGDDDDEMPQDTYEENPDFEGLPVADMGKSLATWVHHTQHILQQGRCTWINLTGKSEDADEEGDEEDKEDEPDEPEPEVGPSLLTPISEDAEVFNTPAWSLSVSSALTPQYAIAALRSNLWPGAYAYATGKKFENIYIGWGLKYAGEDYTPCVPPVPQKEYPSGPEITEALDPSLEEELALKAAYEEKQAALEDMEDMDGGGDDDDDDD